VYLFQQASRKDIQKIVITNNISTAQESKTWILRIESKSMLHPFGMHIRGGEWKK
jgi:hypothetical protein